MQMIHEMLSYVYNKHHCQWWWWLLWVVDWIEDMTNALSSCISSLWRIFSCWLKANDIVRCTSVNCTYEQQYWLFPPAADWQTETFSEILLQAICVKTSCNVQILTWTCSCRSMNKWVLSLYRTILFIWLLTFIIRECNVKFKFHTHPSTVQYIHRSISSAMRGMVI